MITPHYKKYLKNKIYKLLPFFEENEENLPRYLDSLIYEMYGLQYLVDDKLHPMVVTLICILEHFYDECILGDYDIEIIRREVFHCLDLIEKFIKEEE